MGAAAGLQGFADGTGGGMMCKWMEDEVCVNSDCPAVADFCPVVNHPGVCRYEEMDGECKNPELPCMDCQREFWIQEVE